MARPRRNKGAAALQPICQMRHGQRIAVGEIIAFEDEVVAGHEEFRTVLAGRHVEEDR
ncbi:hypothetical protein D3C86_2201750 [compost metagenome]